MRHDSTRNQQLDVLIAVCGVISMCLVARRTIYRRPPIIHEITAAVQEHRNGTVSPSEASPDDWFKGELDWPHNRADKG